jgi:hypothetical protein
MLVLNIGAREAFDNKTQEFVKVGGTRVEMEHSLYSLSKWESIWEKPFLDPRADRTREETISYIEQMIVAPSDLPSETLEQLTNGDVKAVNEYINRKMTATTIHDLAHAPAAAARPTSEMVTAEVMYYWLVALNIPFECQYWHLERLITLVKVINLKQSPPKKMSRREIADQQRRLNAERRAKYGTQG